VRLFRKFGRKVFTPFEITLDCAARASSPPPMPLTDDAPIDLLWYAPAPHALRPFALCSRYAAGKVRARESGGFVQVPMPFSSQGHARIGGCGELACVVVEKEYVTILSGGGITPSRQAAHARVV
jgi:hypothetical protein